MDKDNEKQYFFIKLGIDYSFIMIEKNRDAYQFDSFSSEVDWIYSESNIYDDFKDFLICLAIFCYAIRNMKEIPEAIINILRKYIEINFFEDNINYFQKDEDYEDILRDYENVKSIFV
jgi:hypothetical protein